jgi:hypothetical protein
LADRFLPKNEEKAFLRYHAALGLLSAARSLDIDDLPKVRAALDLARQERLDRDQGTVLGHVDDELDRRLADS